MFIDWALKLRSTDRLPRDCFISLSVSFPSPSTILLLPLSLPVSSPLTSALDHSHSFMWWFSEVSRSRGLWKSLCLPSNCADAQQSLSLPSSKLWDGTEEWRICETMNEPSSIWSLRAKNMINCVIYVFLCWVFMYFRTGMNLLEEKARKKMSSHSFNSLSAAQVGPSGVSPGSSTHLLTTTSCC